MSATLQKRQVRGRTRKSVDGRAWIVRTLVGALLTLVGFASGEAALAERRINVVSFAGSINPASSDYFQHAIEQSATDGAELLIIELDTPGGLVASTKDILQAMLNSPVPIVVYVSPQGGWAASAGTFITMAAHVAVMAPGTTIGAAHPVGVGEGRENKDGVEDKARDFAMEKAENFLASYIESIAKQRERNVEWAVKAVRESVAIGEDEALELGVIDLVAENRAKLIEALDGREVKIKDEVRTLHTKDAEVHPIEMTWVTRFFSVLASPDIAVILLMAGLMGLYIEFQTPGLGFAGVAGFICLILGAISLQILPFDWLGLFLLLIGVGCLIAEIYVTSYGALAVIGIVCFLAGGSMVFDVPEASDLTVSFWKVLVPVAIGFTVFSLLVAAAVGKTFSRKQVAGLDELIGLTGKVLKPLEPEGMVFVRGEYWTARADETIEVGASVEVLAVESLTLRVRRARNA